MDDTKKMVALTPTQVSALWYLVGDKVVELLDHTHLMQTDGERALLEETIDSYRELMEVLNNS